MGSSILVIEDNPANSDLMTYLLSAYGHEPRLAATAEDGLHLAQQTRPDLIVCDIQLPGMDGYMLARRVKADVTLAEVPLVAVTALAMVGDRDKVLAAGFDGYIPKPIDPETFVPRIDGFLQKSPRSRSAHISSATTEGGHVAEPRSGVTILAVDDNPVNLSLVSSILVPLGYHVATASGVSQGIKAARELQPHLIISDVGMVGESGLDLVIALKADPQLRKIPFMFMTSTHRDHSTREKGLAAGADRYLIRPLEPQQLLTEIEACLLEAGTT